MPRQPHYITQPAVIAKGDIAKYAAMHDFANSVAMEVNGKTYQAGTIRFATFAGTRSADGKYRGVYQFEEGDFSGCLQADLNALPQFKPELPKTKTFNEAI